MPSPEDERGRSGSGDIFEDLDDFFAPIEETDWPEPDPGGPPRAPRPPARAAEGDEEDLLPEGWDEAIDVGDVAAPASGGSATAFSLEEDEEEAEEEAFGGFFTRAEAEADAPVEPLEPAEAPAPAAPEATGVAEEALPELPAWERAEMDDEPAVFIDDQRQPTAEGETSVWAGLEPATGDASGDVYLVEAAAAGAEPSPPSSDDSGEGTRELSVEDLRSSPPQYADLPGPPEAGEAPSPARPATDEPTFSGPAFEEPGFTYEAEQEPLVPAGATPGGESADVEAAAEHFAEGLRGSPDEVERELLADMEAPGGAPPRTVRVGEPVGGTGPSWEEPASQPVATERERPPTIGRNLPAALVTGVGLAVLALVLIAIGPAPFAFLAGAVVLLAQGELYAVLRRRGYQPATALGLVCGGLLVYAAYNKGESAMAFIVFLSLALTVAWFMAAPVKARRGTVPNIAVTMLGLIYVPFAAAFIFRILPLPFGRAIALSIIGVTVLYDVAAFAIGSLWGRRPLAPTISPNKSWEGAIAASLITLFVSLAIVASIDPFGAGSALGLAAVVMIAAPLGDLAESVLKRDLGVKDMGTILPGHGGLLDRIDSLLFVLPAAYYFLRIVL